MSKLERIRQELAELKLTVEGLHTNRIPQLTIIVDRSRKNGDIRIGDKVRVLNKYRCQKGVIGEAISKTSAQAKVLPENSEQSFIRYKKNLELLQHG